MAREPAVGAAVAARRLDLTRPVLAARQRCASIRNGIMTNATRIKTLPRSSSPQIGAAGVCTALCRPPTKIGPGHLADVEQMVSSCTRGRGDVALAQHHFAGSERSDRPVCAGLCSDGDFSTRLLCMLVFCEASLLLRQFPSPPARPSRMQERGSVLNDSADSVEEGDRMPRSPTGAGHDAASP